VRILPSDRFRRLHPRLTPLTLRHGLRWCRIDTTVTHRPAARLLTALIRAGSGSELGGLLLARVLLGVELLQLVVELGLLERLQRLAERFLVADREDLGELVGHAVHDPDRGDAVAEPLLRGED